MSEVQTDQEQLVHENQTLRQQIASLQAEVERLTAIHRGVVVDAVDTSVRRQSAKTEALEALPDGTDVPRSEDLAAQQAHLLLEAVIEHLPDATFVVDQDKRIIAWNQACELLTGAKKESLLGRGDYAYAVPFYGERRPLLIDLLDAPSPEVERYYHHLRRNGSLIFAESFLPRVKEGQGAYFWAEAAPLFDQEGRRCGAIEVVRDITEQKHVEQALRESETKYRSLFETSGDAILLMSEDRCVDCNARTLELFGCTREQIIGAPAVRFSPAVQPDGRRSDEKSLEKVKLALVEGPQFFEWQLRRVDGTLFSSEVSLNRLEFGGQEYVQSIARDITLRKQAEEDLQETNRELRVHNSIVSAITDVLNLDEILHRVLEEVLSLVELEGGSICVVTVDDALEVAIRRPGPVLTQGPAANRFRVGDCLCSQCVSTHSPEILRAREQIRACAAREPAQGTPIAFHASFPLVTGGRCVGVLCVFTSTDKRPSERRLRLLETVSSQLAMAIENSRLYSKTQRHVEEMEQRVLARTEQLAAKNQELKEFAYTVSHDLKAPLRGIAGYANELVRKHRSGLSDRAHFCLTQILTAASHLDELIEDLLHYSRLDAEIPSFKEVNLSDLVDGLLRDRALVISEQRMEVTVDIPFSTLRTWERGLVQVLTNLIDNAIKYSRKASAPRMRIAAETFDRSWRLTVNDNGIGFDMKYHDRIFGLFNRLVRMEDYEGTGAGLAIARKVVEKQGGRLWAESAPGLGATFFVEIAKPTDTARD